MKIIVLGAGSIGSVFGGFLARAGHDVTLIGRNAHIQAIRNNGLLIDGIWGSYKVLNLHGYTSFSELEYDAKEKYDLALLTVKSYDTETVLKEFIHYTGDPPPVVSLQNGLGNIEKVESSVGREKTIGGRVIFGVEFINPGHVTVTVAADKTYIGGLHGGANRDFIRKAACIFNEAGIPAEETDTIHKFIWGKVLYNCALNPLATLLDVHYGKLLSCDMTKKIMEHIIREIFTVAHAMDITLEWNNPETYTTLLFEELIPKTFEHHPSMLQDIRRCKKTEIDALNGAVVNLGKQSGIDTPFNWTITELIKAKEPE